MFVSSTSQDLADYRAVARNVILDQGWHPVMMEHFGANVTTTVEACRRELERCDLMLLVMAFRRGWVPTAEQDGNGLDSITALELAHARAKNIPVLALMARDDWPGNLWEGEQNARQWVETFRKNLNLPAAFFEFEQLAGAESERLPKFRTLVRQALVAHKERLLKEEAAHGDDGVSVDFFQPACDGVLEGNDIPFIGMGIYGTGPLSSAALAHALGGPEQAQEQSLATVAEYYERFNGSRDTLLRQFRRILEEQSAQVASIPVFDLLSGVRALRSVVCATFDRELERRLDAAGTPLVVVTHILRSAVSEHEGKLLVLRRGAPPEICLADKLAVRDDEIVVYRPLGSPFLHDGLEPDLEIDTVVVTETDHLTFLSRLENQHTGIPQRMVRLFKSRALLFLGYGLDVWQYRLVMQVFQSLGTRGPRGVTRAVRQRGSAMEEVAWKRLHADLIRMHTDEFVRRARERGGARV